MRNIGIAAADAIATNSNGTTWATSDQVAAAKSKLYTVAVNIPNAIGADRMIWFFDTAAGAVTDVDPKFWIRAFNGVTTVVDLAGKLFINGIYYVVATDEPSGPTAAPTEATADDALVTTDYRVL